MEGMRVVLDPALAVDARETLALDAR